MFKLMNNSVFGKCIQNVKNYIEMKLTTKESMAVKYFYQKRSSALGILTAYIW